MKLTEAWDLEFKSTNLQPFVDKAVLIQLEYPSFVVE